MTRYIARRLLEFIPVLFIIMTLTFFMVRLAPGGPFDADKRVSPEAQQRLEAHYRLDAPLLVQYWEY
ncbi:MAG TPA: ABC transporter, partial [Candidatus Hydrogenedentes bacterium]|nr:ABC transporter [Candidatus Hydrogenedentota bacterium]